MTAKYPLVEYTGPAAVKEIQSGDTLETGAAPTAGGVPLVTTTGAQTLETKTLKTAKIDTTEFTTFGALHDANGNKLVGFVGVGASPANLNYLVLRARDGATVEVQGQGAAADVNVNIVPKGAGEARAGGFPIVTTTGTQTLTAKTLVTPIIASFTNATHAHTSNAGGGALDAAAIATGVIGAARIPTSSWNDYGDTAVYVPLTLRPVGGTANTAQTCTADTIYAFPFVAPKRASVLDKLAIHVTTAEAATSCRIAIYANTSSTVLAPLTLLGESGLITLAATGVVPSSSLALSLTPGALYWCAFKHNSATARWYAYAAADMPGFAYDATTFIRAAIGWGGVGHTTATAYPASFPAGGAFIAGTSLANPPVINGMFSA